MTKSRLDMLMEYLEPDMPLVETETEDGYLTGDDTWTPEHNFLLLEGADDAYPENQARTYFKTLEDANKYLTSELVDKDSKLFKIKRVG